MNKFKSVLTEALYVLVGLIFYGLDTAREVILEAAAVGEEAGATEGRRFLTS